jgi:hypothetical protein
VYSVHASLWWPSKTLISEGLQRFISSATAPPFVSAVSICTAPVLLTNTCLSRMTSSSGSSCAGWNRLGPFQRGSLTTLPHQHTSAFALTSGNGILPAHFSRVQRAACDTQNLPVTRNARAMLPQHSHTCTIVIKYQNMSERGIHVLLPPRTLLCCV